MPRRWNRARKWRIGYFCSLPSSQTCRGCTRTALSKDTIWLIGLSQKAYGWDFPSKSYVHTMLCQERESYTQHLNIGVGPFMRLVGSFRLHICPPACPHCSSSSHSLDWKRDREGKQTRREGDCWARTLKDGTWAATSLGKVKGHLACHLRCWSLGAPPTTCVRHSPPTVGNLLLLVSNL